MFEFKSMEYRTYLEGNELSSGTIVKYLSDVERFFAFLEGKNPEFSDVSDYKAHLIANYKSSSVNSYLISLNRYLRWTNREDLCVKLVRCQRTYFANDEFSVDDYRKMLNYASCHDDKWYLLMRCLASTGIRVGELKFITCETLRQYRTMIVFVLRSQNFRQIVLKRRRHTVVFLGVRY